MEHRKENTIDNAKNNISKVILQRCGLFLDYLRIIDREKTYSGT
jgi:hypothetical protein